MGHVTDAMTAHYSFVEGDEKRAAVRRVLRLVQGAKNGSAPADSGDRSGDDSGELDAEGGNG